MDANEKVALQELFEKLPENELEKAIGGLSEENKKLLVKIGILGAGVAIGVTGTLLTQRLTNKPRYLTNKPRYKFPIGTVKYVPEIKEDIDNPNFLYHKNPLRETLNDHYTDFLKLNGLTTADMSLDAFCDLCKNVKAAHKDNYYEEYPIA